MCVLSTFYSKESSLFNKLLAKLGTDGFSLVLFGTKVSDSKEFCKKSNKKFFPESGLSPRCVGSKSHLLFGNNQPMLECSTLIHRTHLLFLFLSFEFLRLLETVLFDREAQPHQDR